MTLAEESLIYDALHAMQENSAQLAELVNAHGTDQQREAYKSGVYAPCIKLQLLLGFDALERGQARYEQIAAAAKSYFARRQSGADTKMDTQLDTLSCTNSTPSKPIPPQSDSETRAAAT